MIVRMAKIIVMGPLDLLMETLTSIQQLGILQIDTESLPEEVAAPASKAPSIIDKDTAIEHQLYEKLRKKIDELLFYLTPPEVEHIAKTSVLNIDSLVVNLQGQLDEVKKRKQGIDTNVSTLAALLEYSMFIKAVGHLDDSKVRNDVHCVGIHITKTEDMAYLIIPPDLCQNLAEACIGSLYGNNLRLRPQKSSNIQDK